MKNKWDELKEKYTRRQVLFIAGEWMPCYEIYKNDPAKLQASMTQVHDMVDHKHAKYVIDKLYAAMKITNGRPVGYCSHWMDKAFCLKFEPEGIEDETVRSFVKDNLGWFRNLEWKEEGFHPALNELMRSKVRKERRKFIFDEEIVKKAKSSGLKYYEEVQTR